MMTDYSFTQSVRRTLVTVCVAGAVLLSNFLDFVGGAVILGLVAALCGILWPRLLDIPAKKTLGAVLAITGILAVASVVAASFFAWPEFLVWVPACLAAGVIAVFVVQLIRGSEKTRRWESAAGAMVGLLVVCGAAGWQGARYFPSEATVVALTALLAVLVMEFLPLKDPVSEKLVRVKLVGQLILGALAAVGMGMWLGFPLWAAAVLGVVTALLVAVVDQISLRMPGGLSGKQQWVEVVTLSLSQVLMVGPAVYFVDRVIWI